MKHGVLAGLLAITMAAVGCAKVVVVHVTPDLKDGELKGEGVFYVNRTGFVGGLIP